VLTETLPSQVLLASVIMLLLEHDNTKKPNKFISHWCFLMIHYFFTHSSGMHTVPVLLGN